MSRRTPRIAAWTWTTQANRWHALPFAMADLRLASATVRQSFSMRNSLVMGLLTVLCAVATAQSSDPPTMLILKERLEGGSEVRLLSSQFAPNTSSQWHTHPTAVAVYVENGTGLWEIEGKTPKEVTSGQGLLEPANKRSRVTNVLSTQVLKLVSFQVSAPARPFSIPSN